MSNHRHQSAGSPLVPASSETAETMKGACEKLLDSLTPALRAKAHFAFDAPERRRWHYVPREMFDRKGLSLKEMNQRQRRAAFKLLEAGLSYECYGKVTAIMDLEKTLGLIEQSENAAHLIRDPQLYFFSVFGDPTAKKSWGWRAEGHHVSLNFTVAAGEWIAPNPLFLGANPAEVPGGSQRGLRILAKEEDLARELLADFGNEQKRRAIISPEAPADIVTRALPKVDLDRADGLAAGTMAANQQQMLDRLIRVYVERLPPELAATELKRLKVDGLETIHFAWAGSQEHGRPHYYRLHGPSFLVEYDNTQNNANHIHTVWRNLKNDFGEDLLRRHYRQDHG